MSQQFSGRDTKELISKFEIETTEASFSEEALFQLLADHIAYMIEYRLDFLLSLMYRLDIDEAKINWALNPASPVAANIGLAQLVMERQKERMRTKETYRPKSFEDMDDWAF